jgi:hypothetical protein
MKHRPTILLFPDVPMVGGFACLFSELGSDLDMMLLNKCKHAVKRIFWVLVRCSIGEKKRSLYPAAARIVPFDSFLFPGPLPDSTERHEGRITQVMGLWV